MDNYWDNDLRISDKNNHNLTINNTLLNLFFWNIAGLGNLYALSKLDILKIKELDIITLCETWHSDVIHLTKDFCNYEIVDKKGTRRPGIVKGRASGGLAILFKRDLFSLGKILYELEFMLLVELVCKATKKCVVVGSVYIKPNSENEFEILEMINDICLEHEIKRINIKLKFNNYLSIDFY